MRAKRGRPWETKLSLWHQDYLRDRRAKIFQTNPKVKIIKGKAIYEKKGPPDFVGVAGGRAVCFDAKECRASRWPLAALADHQAKDLEAHAVNGGVSFIALRHLGKASVLPWTTLGPLWWAWRDGTAGRGAASLTVDQVAELGIPMNDDGWIDWVEVAA